MAENYDAASKSGPGFLLPITTKRTRPAFLSEGITGNIHKKQELTELRQTPNQSAYLDCKKNGTGAICTETPGNKALLSREELALNYDKQKYTEKGLLFGGIPGAYIGLNMGKDRAGEEIKSLTANPAYCTDLEESEKVCKNLDIKQ